MANLSFSISLIHTPNLLSQWPGVFRNNPKGSVQLSAAFVGSGPWATFIGLGDIFSYS